MNESVGEHDYSKICDFFYAFFKSKHKKFQEFFASCEKKVLLELACMIAHTVQLLRHDAYCPIILSY